MRGARGIAVAMLVTGCYEQHAEVREPDGTTETVREWRQGVGRDVDLLLMIDDSGSMTEEQVSLAVELPRMLRVMASGDLDGDSIVDGPRAASVHVGVVTSDMGTGGHRVPTCLEPVHGDDGMLRTVGNTAISGCAASYPPFLEWEPGEDAADVAHDLTCVARMGTGGCGFEQQLDAVLKAVTPSTSPIRFFRGTTGHGDGVNAGFVREGSVLAIVLLTDEEDCSALDPDIFDPMSPTYTGDLNLRCFMYPGAVYPESRYVDGLLALRDPERLVFVSIAGIPVELQTPRGDEFDAMLDHPRMQNQIDLGGSASPRLVPSCNVPGRGIAFPPRRIVTVGRDLHRRGAHSAATSICAASFAPAIDTALTHVREALESACLPHALEREEGVVDCVLTIDGEEQPQLAVGAEGAAPGEGWYYDDFSTARLEQCGTRPARIGFRTAPPAGAIVRLACREHGP